MLILKLSAFEKYFLEISPDTETISALKLFSKIVIRDGSMGMLSIVIGNKNLIDQKPDPLGYGFNSKIATCKPICLIKSLQLKTKSLYSVKTGKSHCQTKN